MLEWLHIRDTIIRQMQKMEELRDTLSPTGSLSPETWHLSATRAWHQVQAPLIDEAILRFATTEAWPQFSTPTEVHALCARLEWGFQFSAVLTQPNASGKSIVPALRGRPAKALREALVWILIELWESPGLGCYTRFRQATDTRHPFWVKPSKN